MAIEKNAIIAGEREWRDGEWKERGHKRRNVN